MGLWIAVPEIWGFEEKSKIKDKIHEFAESKLPLQQ